MDEPVLLWLVCGATDCRAAFAMCRPCYRGHVFCSRVCAGRSRRFSQRESRRKHQASPDGRLDHRDRNRRWRARCRSVTAHCSAFHPSPDDASTTLTECSTTEPAVSTPVEMSHARSASCPLALGRGDPDPAGTGPPSAPSCTPRPTPASPSSGDGGAARSPLAQALSLWQTTRLHAVLAVAPGADGWPWTPDLPRSDRVTLDTFLVARAGRLSDLRRLVEDRRADARLGGGHAE